jgi:hypothetical protein
MSDAAARPHATRAARAVRSPVAITSQPASTPTQQRLISGAAPDLRQHHVGHDRIDLRSQALPVHRQKFPAPALSSDQRARVVDGPGQARPSTWATSSGEQCLAGRTGATEGIQRWRMVPTRCSPRCWMSWVGRRARWPGGSIMCSGLGTVAETVPYHWRDSGATPRPPLARLVAWVLSRELGRLVTPAEL